MKKLVLVLMIMTLLGLCSGKAQAAKLTGKQQKRANAIIKVCTDKYAKYGVLPSVCIGQAILESGLGNHCSGNNYWGLNCGRTKYSSLKNGTLAYLRCINNGYYKKAPFQKNYRKQVRYIVNGGYCASPSNYFRTCTSIIRKYNLKKYDKEMFKELKERKQEKLEKKRAAKLAKKQQREKEEALAQGEAVVNNTTNMVTQSLSLHNDKMVAFQSIQQLACDIWDATIQPGTNATLL